MKKIMVWAYIVIKKDPRWYRSDERDYRLVELLGERVERDGIKSYLVLDARGDIQQTYTIWKQNHAKPQ